MVTRNVFLDGNETERAKYYSSSEADDHEVNKPKQLLPFWQQLFCADAQRVLDACEYIRIRIEYDDGAVKKNMA